MRRVSLAAALVVGAVALVADLRRPTAPAVSSALADKVRRSVGRCVSYGQALDDAGDSVRLRLASRCDFRVTCDLSWVVSCDGAAGDREAASFQLDQGESRSSIASAASCKGDWEIDDVRWTCEKAD